MLDQPISANLQQETKFLLTFPRLVGTQYFCQRVNIPGIEIGFVNQTTPFVDLPVPGDKLMFQSLNITFIVDTELNAYLEIQKWMFGMAFPENYNQYNNLRRLSPIVRFSSQPQYSDATLIILTGINKPSFHVEFKDCFPTELSGIDFNSTDENVTTIIADAKFKYSYYNIIKV